MPFRTVLLHSFRLFSIRLLQAVSVGVLIVFSCVFVGGCDKQPANSLVPAPVSLVKVNGEVISDADVNFLIEKMLADDSLSGVDNTLRQKILDSLIASRAMRHQVEKQLSANELEHISRSVKSYEEELFVKAYLQKNVVPEPVTIEMIQQYYNENEEEFGAGTVSDFELLKAPAGLADVQRDQLLASVAEIKKMPNWDSESKLLQQKYSLQYLKGRYKKGLFDQAFEQTLAGLKQGQTSDAFFVEGELHLVRLLSVVKSSAKPLSEVSADIRKKLAAVQLREAVKKASEMARLQAKVETLNVAK